MIKSENYLVWIDTEGIQGLDIRKSKIIQIAMLITNEKLEPVSEGVEIIIHHSEKTLTSMNKDEVKMHKKSGLIEKSRMSTVSTKKAELMLIDTLQKFVEPKTTPLCGNSVYMDRIQIMRNMPGLNNYLHYRNIDVSTLKELCKRWYPQKPMFKKNGAHTALSDIKESIEELKYYKKNILV